MGKQFCFLFELDALGELDSGFRRLKFQIKTTKLFTCQNHEWINKNLLVSERPVFAIHLTAILEG